jgi:large subunit ribosomal protein L18
MSNAKYLSRLRRHERLRKKVSGTSERPRMSVCFTGRNIHVQFIDDLQGVTIAAVSSTEEALAKEQKNRSNVAFATKVGKLAAERAMQKQIKAVVFDRGGSKYHGKVKALADAAREVGLQF